MLSTGLGCSVHGLCAVLGPLSSDGVLAGLLVTFAVLLWLGVCAVSSRRHATRCLCAAIAIMILTIGRRLRRDLAREADNYVLQPQSIASDALGRPLAERLDSLFASHACTHAYLDVGSNLGVQIRKVYEPHKYPNAPVLTVFDEAFGAAVDRCRLVCAIGVEPNPWHAKRLSTLERKMNAVGAGVLVLRAAAGTRSGSVQFSVKADSSTTDTGAGVYARGKHTGETVRVDEINLAAVIAHVRSKLPPGGQLVMKLDIEGYERTVWPHLRATGAACLVNRTFVEWHLNHAWLDEDARADIKSIFRGASSRFSSAGVSAFERWLYAAVRPAEEVGARCPLSLLDMDDETYTRDGKEWPANGSLCTSPTERQRAAAPSSKIAARAPPPGRTVRFHPITG